MKLTVTREMFHEQFRLYNRIDQFSYAARDVLFDYYTEIDETNTEETELDVIGICCDWVEYSTEEAEKVYGMSIKELRENYLVIDVEEINSILILG